MESAVLDVVEPAVPVEAVEQGPCANPEVLELDVDDSAEVALTTTAIPSAPRLRRHLLVLDVNGLLIDRRRKPHATADGVETPPDVTVGTFFVYNRPFMREFVSWALSNFVVGVWSSARQHNLQGLVHHIFGPRAQALAFIWGQERCTYCGTIGGRHGKPVYIKELRRIWDEHAFAPFGPSNTLLIDDDQYKASKNPPNTAVHPLKYEFGLDESHADDALSIGGNLCGYLSRVAQANSVPEFVLENPWAGDKLPGQGEEPTSEAEDL